MKRYEPCLSPWGSPDMTEDPQGKYCLYEDVPQWVSVEERLPENNIEVLGVLQGCVSGKYVQRVIEHVDATDHVWEMEGWEISNAWDVICWRYLPQFPEDNDDD